VAERKSSFLPTTVDNDGEHGHLQLVVDLECLLWYTHLLNERGIQCFEECREMQPNKYPDRQINAPAGSH
jgi:hypothetical protein